MFLCWIILSFVACGSLGQSIKPISTSSGLYYEQIGDVLLSNNNWEFVTSIDYGGYLVFYEYIHQQAQKLQEFCQKYKSTDCENRVETIRTAMNSIEDVDEIMANYLGIERRRRIKRFWQQILTIAAPYILEPLGRDLSKSLFGGNMDEERLDAFVQEISGLYNSQQDLANQVQEQRTLFLMDSERKGNQIDYLKRTQDGIENDLKMLRSSVWIDSAEKDMRINELNKMLADTKNELKRQQMKLTKVENDVEDVKVKIKDIDDDIKTLWEDIAVNKGNIEAVGIGTKLNSLSINFKFLLDKFGAEQKILLDVIHDANRGYLGPQIVTPANLIEMMRNVQPMLPEHTRFPFVPTFMNASSLYKLIRPTVYLHSNRIMFILRMPLVYSRSFEIYKMTSLPMRVDENKFVFVLPKKDYLFINEHSLEYLLTSADDFREFCQETRNKTYICEQMQQTSRGASSNLDCEAQVFLNEKELSSSCDTRVVNLRNTLFLQLKDYGSWVYVAPNTAQLILSCDNKRSNEVISGTGILHVSNGCTARTSDSTLKPITGSKPQVVTKVYIPEKKLTERIDTSPIEKYFKSATSNPNTIILTGDNSELRSISTSIRDIEDTADSLSNFVLVIIVVLIVLLIILYIGRKYIHNLFCAEKMVTGELSEQRNNVHEEDKLTNVKMSILDVE